MALLRNARIEGDEWSFVADGQPIPEFGPVLVTLGRYRAERAALDARRDPVGLVLDSDETPRDLDGKAIGRFGLICLRFPKFTDGRPYSAARLLRQRYGFTGELRAIGNVLRDQLAFMRRCGFDAYEIPDDANALKWLRALNEISVHMQPAVDGPADRRAPRSVRPRLVAEASLSA